MPGLITLCFNKLMTTKWKFSAFKCTSWQHNLAQTVTTGSSITDLTYHFIFASQRLCLESGSFCVGTGILSAFQTTTTTPMPWWPLPPTLDCRTQPTCRFTAVGYRDLGQHHSEQRWDPFGSEPMKLNRGLNKLPFCSCEYCVLNAFP